MALTGAVEERETGCGVGRVSVATSAAGSLSVTPSVHIAAGFDIGYGRSANLLYGFDQFKALGRSARFMSPHGRSTTWPLFPEAGVSARIRRQSWRRTTNATPPIF